MLVPLRAILEATDKYGYAQGAFNVNAVAQAKAAIEVHEMFRSPAILQGADLANGFMGGRTDFMNATLEDKIKGAANIGAAVKKYGEASPIPVALHLDHGRNFESCKAAIAGGYTSVMIDGSSLPFEENIELTREVVKYAHERGVLFCVLVSHGSSTVPQYIVKEINALGGDIQNAYGIELAQLKEAAGCGIGKINVDTDIRLAVTRNMKELFSSRPELQSSPSVGGIYKLLEEKRSAFDPRAFLPPIMDTVMYGSVPDADVAAIVECIERGVKEVVGTLIVEFGSVGKAPLVERVTLAEMAERYRKAGI